MGRMYTHGLRIYGGGWFMLIPFYTSPSDYSAIMNTYDYKSLFYQDTDGTSKCLPMVADTAMRDHQYPIHVALGGKIYHGVELRPRLRISGGMTGNGVTDSLSGYTNVIMSSIQTKEYWTGKMGIKINTPVDVKIQGTYRNSVRVESSVYTLPKDTTAVSGALRSVSIYTDYSIRIAVKNTETNEWEYSGSITRGKNWAVEISLGI